MLTEQTERDVDQKPDSSGWSASQYNHTASFVYSASYTAPVLAALNAQPGERIIDFGCGTGELTLQIKDIVGAEGFVVGVDASESMITGAKANGLEAAFVSDIQNLQTPVSLFENNTFDAVFSNAALHWCKRDPKGVLEGVKRVLKEGGRFVCEMGGYMNCVGPRMALNHAVKRRGYASETLDPWYFPSIHDYENLLQSSGFHVDHISLHPRLTPLSAGGLHGWLHLFARNSFLKIFNDKEAEEIINEVVQMCEVDCKDGRGEWSMMYVRLRFSATLK
ncbi:hypothetical protein SERLA73DRAFT_182980 [Serpula lacrymans var. lacrymans S7.3]|uniref:Methyltransferase domain-containing protein n=2 Tax=Serpula lacrymans var. lacrymans TaxID=341189 RepID=F8Q1D5_SERL3|nr:uncharacterized protein SERLADRAFT_469903 [Serpula lacrymans var. lacrymans S7.9]EGN98113.1 hypothetical protein SERLA73DRAFT_182980 [Serpula lacrymans var. lacrymans S7.3]EGO23695.1 hypothetical protein SERLADRAFT_469903 [Serpula lacrymans var. lacrymans S7.9]